MWTTIVKLFMQKVLPKLLPIVIGRAKSFIEGKISKHAEPTTEETVARIAKDLNAESLANEEKQAVTKKKPAAKKKAPAKKKVAKKTTKKAASKLHAAILKLDSKNADHWAYYGKKAQRPDVDAVAKIAGERYTVKEIKDVWSQLK